MTADQRLEDNYLIFHTYQTMSKTKNSLDSTDSSDDAGGDNDNCVANERELR